MLSIKDKYLCLAVLLLYPQKWLFLRIDIYEQNKIIMKLGTWIGGVMGFVATGGPLGALLGYLIGSYFDKSNDDVAEDVNSPQGQRNSFLFSLLVLASYVIRADNRIMHSEMEFVRNFLRKTFGEGAVKEGEQILLDLFEQQQ